MCIRYSIERAARPAQYLIVLALMLFIAVLAFQMQVIVHEGGHLLFGLLCGYRFLSFRIGSLMLIKTGEGFRKMCIRDSIYFPAVFFVTI